MVSSCGCPPRVAVWPTSPLGVREVESVALAVDSDVVAHVGDQWGRLATIVEDLPDEPSLQLRAAPGGASVSWWPI